MNYMDQKEELIMKLVHYFITEENYEPMIVNGVKNEIWLENLEAPYKVIRINSNYIHNDDQLEFDNFKIKNVTKQIKQKTLTLNMKTLNLLLDVGDNVNIKPSKNIDNYKINDIKDLRDDNSIAGLFPKLKTISLKKDNSFDTFVRITNDINEKNEEKGKRFENIFAPKKTLHGVLVEVYGVGILLTGHSGVGKSECALELVERGHRLVADDIVEIRCVNGNSALGQGANNYISHHMEIRGLGIINVSQLYGVGSIREQKEIQLIIKLEEWDQNKIYDRIGTDQSTTDLLGVKIPTIEIPVRPGRNLPIIIEAAAMNERLKAMGYNSARDFNQNILKWIESGEAQTAYYGSDDSY